MALQSVVAILFAVIGVTAASLSGECVDAHNKLRNLHENTGPLTWDSALAQGAKEWADELARKGSLVHGKGDFGENLYWSSSSSESSSCSRATLNWYNEYNDYSYSTTESINGKAVGHFTQVVWKDSTKVGVGVSISQDPNGGTYVVARYTPKGNFLMMHYGESWGAARIRIYEEKVAKRKAGAVTPNIFQLDPSTCVNKWDEGKCKQYADYFKCSHSYVQFHCPKYCEAC